MWRTVKLGQVIEKTRTVNPSTEFPNDYFEYVDVSSVNNAALKIEETQKLLGEDAPSRARRQILENDIIFATIRPTLRRIALVPSSLNGQICSTGYTVLRANRKQVLPTYLFYVMIGSRAMSYMKNSQTGASYPAVTDKQVKDFEFELPPLAEQQRIVAKLDAAFAEIDRAIGVAKAKEAEVDKFKASLLHALLWCDAEMWRTEKLGDILSLQNGYAFKSAEYEDDGYFVMRITNVQQGYISTHNPKYIRFDKGSKLEKFILEEGDILVSLTGDVGRVGVIENEHLPAALNQRVARVTGVKRELVNIDFLFAYMNSDAFRRQVEDFSHGAAQANVSTKDILSINMPLPPLAEQQRIVSKLDTAFAEIDTANAAIASQRSNYSALKSAILAQELQPSEAA